MTRDIALVRAALEAAAEMFESDESGLSRNIAAMIRALGEDAAAIAAGVPLEPDERDAELVALRARVAELEHELQREEAEHNLSTTFHATAVKERDYERARVAELEKDTERLAALAWGECLVDGIGGGDGICIHEEAAINASAFGRDEPNRDDYLAAIRTAIDAAMKEGK